MPTYAPRTVPGATVEEVEADVELSVGDEDELVGLDAELLGVPESDSDADGNNAAVCDGRDDDEEPAPAGRPAALSVADGLELRAWSPNAPTPTPIAKIRIG